MARVVCPSATVGSWGFPVNISTNKERKEGREEGRKREGRREEGRKKSLAQSC